MSNVWTVVHLVVGALAGLVAPLVWTATQVRSTRTAVR
jgi:hypothetical protein